MRVLILAFLSLLLISRPAYALFEDDKARARIIELQQKMDSQSQTTQATLDELKKSQQALEQRLTSIEAVVKGQGLIDLLDQIKQLNDELNNVKGQLEIATHNIESNQQRQRDLYTDLDGRMRKLESGVTPSTSMQPGMPGQPAAPDGGQAAAATAAGGLPPRQHRLPRGLAPAPRTATSRRHRHYRPPASTARPSMPTRSSCRITPTASTRPLHYTRWAIRSFR